MGGPNHVRNYCDAPLLGDGSKQKLYVHPQYYYIGHFSKFLPRGSKRIVGAQLEPAVTLEHDRRSDKANSRYGTCVGGLQSTSFLSPTEDVVTVVLNCGDSSINFKLKDDYRALRASIPAHAIQTYIFPRTTIV